VLNYAINIIGSERFETWRGNLIYCSEWAQHFAGNWGPNLYNTTNEEWLSAYWNEAYSKYMKNIQDVINKEGTTNMAAMAMVLKVMVMQRVTDMYGDIPYSEAFQGGNNPQPAYDTQEQIYSQFINELKTAVAQLQEGNGEDPGEFDGLYNGNITLWKKFANSLLLRIGMRLSEVNPTLAQQTINDALNGDGGVFESNGDMAWISFNGAQPDGVNASGIGEVFQDFGVGGSGFQFSETFVSKMAANHDPRQKVIMVTYDSKGNPLTDIGPGKHKGRPSGKIVNESSSTFAQPNHDVMVAYKSPVLYLTYAEVEFIKAEAMARGWISGDLKGAYEKGVVAAMSQLSLYPNAEEITQEEITAYLAEDGVKFQTAKAIELINTQKWFALLFDGFEAYANQRRIDYPVLVPGKDVVESPNAIPKRLRYPSSEPLTNSENYNAAVKKLTGGKDAITANIWWDKK